MGRNAKISVLFIFVILSLPVSFLWAQQYSADAAVSTQELYLGEIFYYQIQVRGTDTPTEPDLSHFSDFTVVTMSGGANNSQSISIINGKRTETIRRGFNFTYELSPKKPGRLNIPPVTVVLDGREYRTNSVPMIVREPVEVDDYKLELRLEKSECYTGEPVVLDVVWSWAEKKGATELHQFSLPLESGPAVIVRSGERAGDPSATVRLRINDEEVLARRGKERRSGGTFTTISFRRILIPQRAGKIVIPEALVSFEGISGFEKVRDRFSGRAVDRETFDKFVIPSNTPVLYVNPLPKEGRPAGFSGLVGKFRIEAEALPLEVNVGDPITFKVRITGPVYLDDVELPSYKEISEWNDNFKISSDDTDGKVENGSKVFVQTIRAKDDSVTRIPPITLSYFNTENGKYETIDSGEIPLVVRPTKVVTIQDVEGAEAVEIKSEVETYTDGIFFNFHGESLLKNRIGTLSEAAGRPVWIISWIFSVLVFAVPYSLRLIKSKRVHTVRERESRKSFIVFKKYLEEYTDGPEGDLHGYILTGIWNYMRSRLALDIHVLSLQVVLPRLAAHGISETTLAELEDIVRECEAGRYGGTQNDMASREDSLTGKTVVCLEKIEKRLP
jgi:hypothetical protein